jgi:hypothetical protein
VAQGRGTLQPSSRLRSRPQSRSKFAPATRSLAELLATPGLCCTCAHSYGARHTHTVQRLRRPCNRSSGPAIRKRTAIRKIMSCEVRPATTHIAQPLPTEATPPSLACLKPALPAPPGSRWRWWWRGAPSGAPPGHTLGLVKILPAQNLRVEHRLAIWLTQEHEQP